jgi:predicted nucleotidyltransferase
MSREVDLFISKRSHFVRRIMIEPTDIASRSSWRGQDRARTANLLMRSGIRKLGVEFGDNVMDVNRFAVEHRSSRWL